MSLSLYRERVALLAKKRDGEPVFNGSLEHAAIIVEHMFAHAQAHVRVLSGKMNARVYGPEEVMEQARLFLAEPDHTVEILLEDADPAGIKDHPFFEEFGGYPNVFVRQIPAEERARFDFHFLVMDGDSYRFEGDKGSPAAIAAFGDAAGGQHLEDLFADLWARGKTVGASSPAT